MDPVPEQIRRFDVSSKVIWRLFSTFPFIILRREVSESTTFGDLNISDECADVVVSRSHGNDPWRGKNSSSSHGEIEEGKDKKRGRQCTRYLYRDNWWRSWNIPSTPKPLEEAEDYKD
ncbi:hypothetical protein LAZ67_13001239 [Cordylochernes scorpioides]|uniref:Uncharacterized protein n=1 Tax=Cordylochernes scorpioides TaxID=51811 RepID=A0ABY6L4G9_9ARAC|nr:hypothetical protein LAZ67_13001239 [Cordylochernes scorpioides]